MLAGIWLVPPASAAPGDLTFVSCMSDRTGSVGCDDLSPVAPANNSPLTLASDVAVSPNGNAVYATGGQAVVHLFRDATSGAVAYDGCIGDFGNTNCTQTNGDRFKTFVDVEVRPTGGAVYAADGEANAVSHLFALPAGQLVYDGCVSDNGTSGLCADSPGSSLNTPLSMDSAPDGLNLYVPSLVGVITRYAVLPAGQLVFGSCVAGAGLAAPECASLPAPAINGAVVVSVTPDGRSLYASSFSGIDQFSIAPGGALTWVSCLTTDQADRPGCGLMGGPPMDAGDIASDNENVYLSSPSGIHHFRRDTATGALTFADCVARPGVAGCDGPSVASLRDASRLTLSADGGSLYATSADSDSVMAFRRRSTGRLIFSGCWANTAVDGCVDLPGTPLDGATAAAVSPEGKTVYVVAGEANSISRFARELADPIPPLTVDIDSKSKLKLKKLAATATCSEACALTVEADGKAGKKFSSKPVTLNLTAGQATQVRIALKKKLVRKLSGRKGQVTIGATATAFGETATDSDKSKLK